MQLTKLCVENYRALEKCDIDVSKNLTVIIGKNNTGKTSLAGVLSKFLGNESFVYDDLNIHAKASLYNIVMDKEMTEADCPRVSLTLIIAYTNNDSLKNIRPLLLDLDEDNNEVALRFSRSIKRLEDCRADFSTFCSELGEECSRELFERFMTQRHSQYFQTEAVPVYCKNGNADVNSTSQEDSDVKTQKKSQGSPLKPEQIRRIFSFDCVDALRGVSNKESSTTLGDRISNYYSTFKSSSLDQASKSLLGLLLKVDGQLDSVYEKLFSELSNSIKKFGGFRDGDAWPEVTSHISEQNLLTNNTSVTYRSGEGSILPESHNGLGYMNVISIIMDITAKAEKFRNSGSDSEPSAINLLFVEEPEAHTHPQLQTIFIQHLKGLIEELKKSEGPGEISLQCLLTTHSPNVVANADFEDMRYLIRNGSESVQAKNLDNLKATYEKEENQGRANYKFIKQYLTLDRADIFFADKVILIEGDTERILMPSMMSKVDALHSEEYNNLHSQEISVIPAGAYGYVFLPLVNFLGLKTLIITDSDFVNGKYSQKCKYEELSATSNQTIKTLLPDVTDTSAHLKELYSQDRVHTFTNNDGKQWVPDHNGNLGLTFQTGLVDGYHPRSFEDAFIFENEAFLKEKIDSFRSIRSEIAKKQFIDGDKTPYDLAALIDKKTSFAMDLLLAEAGGSVDGNDNKWKVPSYIERGLEWLAEE